MYNKQTVSKPFCKCTIHAIEDKAKAKNPKNTLCVLCTFYLYQYASYNSFKYKAKRQNKNFMNTLTFLHASPTSP